ncbi:MAG: hypothetical protein M1824_001797 [Vezdaea acicularis]|nr:MAG: hypothetical protein M1824_001797 [Vezdaea acicularis]
MEPTHIEMDQDTDTKTSHSLKPPPATNGTSKPITLTELSKNLESIVPQEWSANTPFTLTGDIRLGQDVLRICQTEDNINRNRTQSIQTLIAQQIALVDSTFLYHMYCDKLQLFSPQITHALASQPGAQGAGSRFYACFGLMLRLSNSTYQEAHEWLQSLGASASSDSTPQIPGLGALAPNGGSTNVPGWDPVFGAPATPATPAAPAGNTFKISKGTVDLIVDNPKDPWYTSRLKEIGDARGIELTHTWVEDNSSLQPVFTCRAKFGELTAEAKGSTKKEAKHKSSKALLPLVQR